MRQYSYARNNLHKTASVVIEDASWWVFLLDWLSSYICWLVPAIPFPDIKVRLRGKDDIEFNGGEDIVSLREWWGTLNSWFCLKVHQPISDFCYRRIDDRLVDIDYEKLKEAVIKYDRYENYYEEEGNENL